MTYPLRFPHHRALRAVLAVLTVACAFTAATQAQTVKEVFSDEDLKEKKVEGEWTAIAAPDLKQLSDATSPVAVSMVTSSAGRGKFLGLMKLPEVILDNRGDSALVSARLGWAVVPDGQEAALLEGETPFFKARVGAGASAKVDIPHIFFNRIIKPLLKEGKLNGTYRIVVRVQEARFANGSVWQRPPEVAFLRAQFRSRAAPDRRVFPGGPFFRALPAVWAFSPPPPPQLKPCKGQPRSLNSAVALSAAQITDPSCESDAACGFNSQNQQRCFVTSGLACDLSGCFGGHCNCHNFATCPECSGQYENCTNGLDDDCNGLTDMEDAGQCPPPCICTPHDEWTCAALGLTCQDGEGPGEGCTCVPTSPIVIDVRGDGFSLTDAARGVGFDINGDGAANRISWTAPGSDDAWLSLDRNGNGTVDSGKELFGNFTDQPGPGERNGFLALAEYDWPDKGGNGDGVISALDSVYGHLRLWQDANHDGVSQAGELHALPALGVETLSLDFRESRKKDRHGNEFRYRAKVNGRGRSEAGKWAYDVFLLPAL